MLKAVIFQKLLAGGLLESLDDIDQQRAIEQIASESGFHEEARLETAELRKRGEDILSAVTAQEFVCPLPDRRIEVDRHMILFLEAFAKRSFKELLERAVHFGEPHFHDHVDIGLRVIQCFCFSTQLIVLCHLKGNVLLYKKSFHTKKFFVVNDRNIYKKVFLL